MINESNFGKWKVTATCCGHCMEGGWVFGGVEKGANVFGKNKFFCNIVEDCMAETTLLLLIHK